MTKEQAKAILWDSCIHTPKTKEAIRVLSEERPQGDLISREALKKALNYVYDCTYIGSKSKEGIVSDIIETIDNAPTVDKAKMKNDTKQ